MSLSLKQLRSSALVLLSKAIVDLFPKARLLEGKISDYGFHYDFVLGKESLDKESLNYLEERMILLIRESWKIKFVEMLRENAVSYLRHRKQGLQASFLEESYSPGLMSFLQLGEMIEPTFCDRDSFAELEDLKAFKLLDVYPVDTIKGEQVYRICGTVFHDKNELKVFVKQRALHKEDYHLTLATKLDLCLFTEEGDCLWCSKGLKLLEILLNYWEKECSQLSIEKFKSSALSEVELLEDLSKFYSLKNEGKDFSVAFEGMFLRELEASQSFGLWRSNYYFAERVFFIVDQVKVKRDLISSLQFIAKKGIMLCLECCWIVPKYREFPAKRKKDWEKALKILVEALEECGFAYEFEEKEHFDFAGPKAYLTYSDSFGKKWKGPFVGLDLVSVKEKAVIWRSTFGSFERYIAYLLEWSKGFLPLTIAPEQVRLIARSEASIVYAKKVQAELAESGFRAKIDLVKNQLSTSIFEAEEEKIPYIAVIGDNECEQRMVAVRASGSNKKDRQLAVNAFLLELVQRIYDINSGHILSPVAFLKQINVGTDSD